MEQTSREDQRTLYRSAGTAKISIHKRNALFLVIGRKKGATYYRRRLNRSFFELKAQATSREILS